MPSVSKEKLLKRGSYAAGISTSKATEQADSPSLRHRTNEMQERFDSVYRFARHIPERGFDMNWGTEQRYMENVNNKIAQLQWTTFARPPDKPNLTLTREWFSNIEPQSEKDMINSAQFIIWIRGVLVGFTPETVRQHYNLPQVEKRSYSELSKDHSKFDMMCETLSPRGYTRQGYTLCKKHLGWQSRAWLTFLNTRLFPSTSYASLGIERVAMLYCILEGLQVDPALVIYESMLKLMVARDKKMYFGSLITGICKKIPVRMFDDDTYGRAGKVLNKTNMDTFMDPKKDVVIRENQETEATKIQFCGDAQEITAPASLVAKETKLWPPTPAAEPELNDLTTETPTSSSRRFTDKEQAEIHQTLNFTVYQQSIHVTSPRLITDEGKEHAIEPDSYFSSGSENSPTRRPPTGDSSAPRTEISQVFNILGKVMQQLAEQRADIDEFRLLQVSMNSKLDLLLAGQSLPPRVPQPAMPGVNEPTSSVDHEDDLLKDLREALPLSLKEKTPAPLTNDDKGQGSSDEFPADGADDEDEDNEDIISENELYVEEDMPDVEPSFPEVPDVEEHHGRKRWQDSRSIYGWTADVDGYKDRGDVEDHLWKRGYLRTISEPQQEQSRNQSKEATLSRRILEQEINFEHLKQELQKTRNSHQKEKKILIFAQEIRK